MKRTVSLIAISLALGLSCGVLAQLRHNADAWHQLGNEPAAEAAESKVRLIQGDLALIESLQVQRQAAQAQIETAERVKNIEAQISALRASCNR